MGMGAQLLQQSEVVESVVRLSRILSSGVNSATNRCEDGGSAIDENLGCVDGSKSWDRHEVGSSLVDAAVMLQRKQKVVFPEVFWEKLQQLP